ncbi:amidase [Lichenihabitans psoromatis]|uniref:amidase n=1 Tax=Lichenihabitans psoromatis TaxID=2528642 RepID=UPI001FE05C28|nr:amidase [Lichenihabitans psoromatis]
MTLSDEMAFAELTEVSAQVQAGAVSPVALTEAMLERIAAKDGALHSDERLMPESALAEAALAEAEIARGVVRGPLHGVPLAVKDLCWTADAPTAAGMALHRGFMAPEDGTVVARLRAAGAIILGKLAMTEGAYAGYHPDMTVPLNPWDVEAWPGTSSSGSGAATAAGLCYGSIGSDTGGSIRFPSAANGLTGIKPTWGRVSRYGAFELGGTLDNLGPMTRSARDAAAMLGVIAGYDAKDPTSLRAAVPDYLAGIDGGVAGLRIGLAPRWMAEGTDAPAMAAIEEARRTLVDLGATMVEIDFPDSRQVLQDWFPLCAVEAAVAHEATFPSRRADYGVILAQFLDIATDVTAADMQKIALRRLAFRGEVEAAMDGIDLLLVPVQGMSGPTMADILTAAEADAVIADLLRFSSAFNMTGQPTITLPAGVTSNGRPVGVQLVGRHLDEALLCRAGHAFQSVTDWHKRHPRLQ